MFFVTVLLPLTLSLRIPETSLTQGPAKTLVKGETTVGENAKKLVAVVMEDGYKIVKELDDEYTEMEKKKDEFNKALQAMMIAEKFLRVEPGEAIKASIAVIDKITEFMKKFETIRKDIKSKVEGLSKERTEFDPKVDKRISKLAESNVISIKDTAGIETEAGKPGTFEL